MSFIHFIFVKLSKFKKNCDIYPSLHLSHFFGLADVRKDLAHMAAVHLPPDLNMCVPDLHM